MKKITFSAAVVVSPIQSDTTSDINRHNEWTKSRINTDEQDIENIIKYLYSCNLFNGRDCVLRNIFTCALAEVSIPCNAYLILKEIKRLY